jgi:nucleoside-diphosphate-sugar epimerase
VIAVVGADGYVGGALASALGAGRVVFRAPLPGEIAIGMADSLLRSASIVINAAGFRVRPGLTAADYRRTHEEAVSRLIPRISPGALFVQISSASVLGKNAATPLGSSEGGRPEGFGCPNYAIAKREAEQVARKASSARGVRLVVLRPAILYGREPDGMIGTLQALAAKGILLRLVPSRHRHHLCSLPLLVETVRAIVRRSEGTAQPLVLADPFVVTSGEIAGIARERHAVRLSLPLPAGLVGSLLRRFPRSRSPRLDFRTWGEILCILALDTVYDTAETYRLLGIEASRFSRERTWERLARGLEWDA